MTGEKFQKRLKRCSQLMKSADLEALLLTKPSNMFYLTGDGRLCAYALVTREGKVALGVPQTDIEDVKQLAFFDHLNGFENEVGMIHSIAHHFKHFGINQGEVGLEFTFLTQTMMGMLTHPHAKPKEITVAVGNCGLYTGPWGVRVEDTIVVGADGPSGLTDFPYFLAI